MIPKQNASALTSPFTININNINTNPPIITIVGKDNINNSPKKSST